MIAKYRSVRPSKTVRLDLFASENKKLETDTKGVLENLKTAKLTQIRKQSSAARQVHFVVSRFWLFYKTRGYNRGTRNRAFTPKSVKCATFRANCATLNVVNSRTDTCNNNNVRLLLWISRYWSTCKKSAARPFIFSSCRNGCPLVWTKKPRGRVIKKFVKKKKWKEKMSSGQTKALLVSLHWICLAVRISLPFYIFLQV